MTDLGITLDVDGTIAGFAPAFVEKAKEMGLNFPRHYTQWREWSPEDESGTAFGKVWPEITGSEEFWLRRIKPLQKAHVPYEVDAYVSARSQAPSGATAKWIRKHGFPEAPVTIVDDSAQKISVLREIPTDVYVDDKAATITRLQGMYTRRNDVPLPVLITTPANATHSKDDVSEVKARADYLTEVPSVAKSHLA